MKNYITYINEGRKKKDLRLIKSIKDKDYETSIYLIKNSNINLNEYDSLRNTALLLSVKKKEFSVFKELIDTNNIDIQWRNKNKDNVLSIILKKIKSDLAYKFISYLLKNTNFDLQDYKEDMFIDSAYELSMVHDEKIIDLIFNYDLNIEDLNLFRRIGKIGINKIKYVLNNYNISFEIINERFKNAITYSNIKLAEYLYNYDNTVNVDIMYSDYHLGYMSYLIYLCTYDLEITEEDTQQMSTGFSMTSYYNRNRESLEMDTIAFLITHGTNLLLRDKKNKTFWDYLQPETKTKFEKLFPLEISKYKKQLKANAFNL